MKQFFIKAPIFLFFFALIALSLSGLAESVQPQDPFLKNAQRNFQNYQSNAENIEMISIGNSHSFAIDFKQVFPNQQGHYLGRAGGDLFENKKYVNYILNKPDNNIQTAFISVSYFSFDVDNAYTNQILRINFYSLIPTLSAENDDMNNLVLGKLQKAIKVMDIARPDNWYGVLTNLSTLSTSTHTPDASPQYESSDEAICHYESSEVINQMSEGRYMQYSDNANTSMQNNPDIRIDNIRALEQTIENFQNHGVTVILFTPPYAQPYNSLFREKSPEMVQHMEQALSEISGKYNVPYFNFSNHPDFESEIGYFTDSDHLNSCGKAAFSKALAAQLTEIP